MTCAFELLKIKFRLKYYAKLYYTIENNKLSVKSWLPAWKSDPSLFNLNIQCHKQDNRMRYKLYNIGRHLHYNTMT